MDTHHVAGYLITFLVVSWLYGKATAGTAITREGVVVFRPALRLRIAISASAIGFSVASLYLLVVTHDFFYATMWAVFGIAAAAAYPPTITVDADAVAIVWWFGLRRAIPWNRVASIISKPRACTVTVMSGDRMKIIHRQVHVDRDRFVAECQRRSGLHVIEAR